jgi:hypothetical protein
MKQARQPAHSVRVCCFIARGGFSLFLFGIETLELHGIFLLSYLRFLWGDLVCSRRGDEGAPHRPVLGKLRPLGKFDREVSMLESAL